MDFCCIKFTLTVLYNYESGDDFNYRKTLAMFEPAFFEYMSSTSIKWPHDREFVHKQRRHFYIQVILFNSKLCSAYSNTAKKTSEYIVFNLYNKFIKDILQLVQICHSYKTSKNCKYFFNWKLCFIELLLKKAVKLDATNDVLLFCCVAVGLNDMILILEGVFGHGGLLRLYVDAALFLCTPILTSNVSDTLPRLIVAV